MRRMESEECFVCGHLNPIGLHMKIEEGEGWARSTWKIEKPFIGYDNIFHGGIMASIMDDMMAHAIYYMDVDVMTAHLEMDYRAPAYVGETITCETHVESYSGRRSIRAAGSIRRGDTVIAEAKGVMVIVGEKEKYR